MGKLLQQPDTYADFEFLAFWQTQYNNMNAVNLFFAWIKVPGLARKASLPPSPPPLAPWISFFSPHLLPSVASVCLSVPGVVYAFHLLSFTCFAMTLADIQVYQLQQDHDTALLHPGSLCQGHPGLCHHVLHCLLRLRPAWLPAFWDPSGKL